MTEKKKPPLTNEQALAAIRNAGTTGDFKMAESDELERYGAEVDEICDMLERVLGIKVAFLSDMSSFGDFAPDSEYPPTDAYYARLSADLGVVIQRGDSIVDVCRRLREQSANGPQ